MDDGSTDDTRSIAGQFGKPVCVLRQPNQGPGAAMSLAMRHSQHPFIASVDADDIWLPQKMQRQLQYLQHHANCHGVFCQLELFGNGVAGGQVQDGWSRSSMVIRRNVFESVGEVTDPPGRRGEMIDWLARARESGFQLALLPKVLARRRVLPGSLSWQRDLEKDRGYLHVARAALLRKRACRAGIGPQP